MQCNTPLSACEFLIALDSLNCTSSGGVIDHPGIALPKDTTTTYAPENLVITGFDCLGNSWTAQVVVEVPDDAWDHTTPTDSRPVTSDRAIWSLVKSDVGAVIARADVANRRIIFRVPGYSGDIPVEPTSGSNEEFYFSRGSAIFLAVTHRMVNGLFEYACYASVGHTGVYHATVTSSTALHPDTMNFFDPDTSNPECMYVWGGTVDESNALQDSNIKSSWKLLSLLFQKTIYMNPTLPPD